MASSRYMVSTGDWEASRWKPIWMKRPPRGASPEGPQRTAEDFFDSAEALFVVRQASQNHLMRLIAAIHVGDFAGRRVGIRRLFIGQKIVPKPIQNWRSDLLDVSNSAISRIIF
jgi:hypothetical protein